MLCYALKGSWNMCHSNLTRGYLKGSMYFRRIKYDVAMFKVAFERSYSLAHCLILFKSLMYTCQKHNISNISNNDFCQCNKISKWVRSLEVQKRENTQKRVRTVFVFYRPPKLSIGMLIFKNCLKYFLGKSSSQLKLLFSKTLLFSYINYGSFFLKKILFHYLYHVTIRLLATL